MLVIIYSGVDGTDGTNLTSSEFDGVVVVVVTVRAGGVIFVVSTGIICVVYTCINICNDLKWGKVDSIMMIGYIGV